ncbi:hypothetical protein H2200_007711 [Cladophialophora chaetospira]|uniref:Tautomerase cis-CaaD-like domain-containing protein n=1 Tax=Cladophialophora chaetospira TaxID=386627 RepID=A0AA39CGV1_9EURO|nr:hypothetical protein H2200_007711 [Cladophialophora chaetospira]
MPVYQILHSFPLTRHQKDLLAERITVLHSTEYLTPSLFVNVNFVASKSTGDFYLAGKPYNGGKTAPNIISGTVRTSPKRTKERWEVFARRLEAAWYEVINGPKEQGETNGANGHSVELSKEERRARKLHLVGFNGVITGIENGVILPSADDEGPWLKKNLSYFKEQAELYDDEPFQDLLQELKDRPDLKKLLES